MAPPTPPWVAAAIRETKQLNRLLFVVYLLKILESFAYFSTALNLTLFLSEAYGFSDEEAGALYGAWGVATGIAGGLFGPVIDRLGIRTSLVSGGTLLVLGRALLAGSHSRTAAMLGLFVFQSVGMALGIPVLMIAVRRLSNEVTSSLAFGLFYACMNIGALIGGSLTDYINTSLRKSVEPAEALRTLLWLGSGASIIYVVIAATCIRLRPLPIDPRESTWTRIKRSYKDPVLWRVCVFSGCLFGTGSIFRHIDATLPKWMQRTMGDHARYGTIYSINPAIVIIAVPLASLLLRRHRPFSIVIIGSFFASTAPLFLGLVTPTYGAAAFFMILVSIGETLYSPKAIEFTLRLAPEGEEGLFGTLAGAPLFLVKIVTGYVGGHLLGTYCPEDGEDQCNVMWLWIAGICFTTPALLLCLRNWLDQPAPEIELEVVEGTTPEI